MRGIILGLVLMAEPVLAQSIVPQAFPMTGSAIVEKEYTPTAEEFSLVKGWQKKAKKKNNNITVVKDHWGNNYTRCDNYGDSIALETVSNAVDIKLGRPVYITSTSSKGKTVTVYFKQKITKLKRVTGDHFSIKMKKSKGKVLQAKLTVKGERNPCYYDKFECYNGNKKLGTFTFSQNLIGYDYVVK